MDVRTARTLNIRDLVKSIGGPTRFANLYGGGAWTQAQISQWVSLKNPRGIGHALARDIEKAIGLQNGALDYYPIGSSPIAGATRISEEKAAYGDPDEVALVEMFRRLPKRKKRAILDLLASEKAGKEKA